MVNAMHLPIVPAEATSDGIEILGSCQMPSFVVILAKFLKVTVMGRSERRNMRESDERRDLSS